MRMISLVLCLPVLCVEAPHDIDLTWFLVLQQQSYGLKMQVTAPFEDISILHTTNFLGRYKLTRTIQNSVLVRRVKTLYPWLRRVSVTFANVPSAGLVPGVVELTGWCLFLHVITVRCSPTLHAVINNNQEQEVNWINLPGRPSWHSNWDCSHMWTKILMELLKSKL